MDVQIVSFIANYLLASKQMGVSYPANNSKIKRTSNLGFIHKYIPNKGQISSKYYPLLRAHSKLKR